MTINIRATDIELTDAIKQYIEEKFSSLAKYESGIMHVDVVVGKEVKSQQKGDIYECSANIEIPGNVLKIERTAEDLYKAIDKVKDHFRETLAQRKEKEIDERRKG